MGGVEEDEEDGDDDGEDDEKEAEAGEMMTEAAHSAVEETADPEASAGAAAAAAAAAPGEALEEVATEAARRQTVPKGDAHTEEAAFVYVAPMWPMIASGPRRKEEEKKEIEMAKNFVKKKETCLMNLS